MIETILILVSAFLVTLYFWKYKRPNNFPPGPTPVPIIGNTFQIPKGHFHKTVETWSKQYGPVVGFSIFGDLFVTISGVKQVLEALRKKEFQSRPDSFFLRQRSFGKCLGIFFSNGEQWASSRKFTVKQLKNFGRNEIENLIANEIEQLMETIKAESTVQGTGLFGLSAVNVIWMIIANKRLDVNNDESRKFLYNLHRFFRQGNLSGVNLINILPGFKYISPSHKYRMRILKDTQDYIRKAIEEHKEVLDPKSPIDLIDHYLVELEKSKSTTNLYFSEEDLIVIGVDLFLAGAESTSNSIEFVLLYMTLYPEVQRKMHEELDQVLGRARKPVLDDKAKLHYTMAVLNEVERLNSIAPLSPVHCSYKDTTFCGYFIPKGTQININLHSLGNDPEYWKNPDEFIPERFLNAEGMYTKSQIFHPFGLGQRICVGEMLARNTIFLFMTTFFEKYSISLPAGEPKPSTDPLPGFTTAPRPFKIHIKSRY